MSHEISEVRMADGRTVTEAMYANKPAWHGLGNIFDPSGEQAPDSEKAMELAHLDWRVEAEPIELVNKGSEEVPSRAITDKFALVRQDTRDTLSIVGSRYEVLQNREAFAFLDSLLMDGIMRYETAFALQGGKGVVLLARMPKVDYVTDEDPQLRYVMCNVWHGGGSVVMMPTTVRVVCANTLRMALGTDTYKVSISHMGDMSQKLSDAKDVLSQFDKSFTGYIEKAKKLLVGYTNEKAAEYIGELMPIREDKEQNAKADRLKVEEVRERFRHPLSERNGGMKMSSIERTWWKLYNSVTEYSDHTSGRQNRDLLKRRENRYKSASDGKGANFKNRAFELALEMAS